MLVVAPRSIWIHCGSEARLDQRVPVALPSTARLGVVPAFSLEEEVATLLRAILVVPQPAATGVLVRVAVGPMGVLVRVAVGPTRVLVLVFVGPVPVVP